MYSEEILKKAKMVFDYLNVHDNTLTPVDLIIGFGHFDMKIPRSCGELYSKGYAERILLTGGRGAGTADLNEPEGIEFEKELRIVYPDIQKENVIVESESTNTGENIQFSENILKDANPDFCFEKGIKKVIAIASPYRQKRVYLCMKKMYPDIQVLNAPPETTFKGELEIFESKNESFIHLLLGELERIKLYPAKGFIAFEEVPVKIVQAYTKLKQLLVEEKQE